MLVPAACPGVVSLPTDPELAPSPGPRRGRVARAQPGQSRAVGRSCHSPDSKPAVTIPQALGPAAGRGACFCGTNPAGLCVLYRGMRRTGSGVPSHPSRYSLRSHRPTFRAGGGAGQGRPDGAAPAAITNDTASLFKSTRSCQSFSSSSASLQSPYWATEKRARLPLFFSVSLLLRGGGAIGRGIIGISAIAIGGGPAPRAQRRAPLLTRPGLPGGGSGGSRGSSPGRRLCKGASSPLLRGPRASGAEAGPQRGAVRSGGAERSRRAEPPGAGK